MRRSRCWLLGLLLLTPSCGDESPSDLPGSVDARVVAEVASADVAAPLDAPAAEDLPALDAAVPEDAEAPEDTATPEDIPLPEDVSIPNDLSVPAEVTDAAEDEEAPGPPPLPDQDGDGVPDDADPMPDDPTLPGVAAPNTVYAHTASTLYTMSVQDYKVAEVGAFGWPAGLFGDQMTDIAIDAYGVLYGVSFGNLFTCHPATAACTLLASLPDSFNGLTFVTKGVLEADKEVLVGVTQAGSWYRLDVVGNQVQATSLGAYGGGYSSAGDAFSIEGVGTFAAVNKPGSASNALVAVDPGTGTVKKEVGLITGYSTVYGLAGWSGRAFAFDASGTILVVDTSSAIVSVAANTGISWWGAGVRTILK